MSRGRSGVSFIICCVAVLLFAGLLPAQAQTTSSGSSNVDAYRAKLQGELDNLNAQDTQLQSQISQLEGQKSSLTRDISLLKDQIAQAQVQIQARNLTIEQLTSDIGDKQNTIYDLNGQLNGELESLAAILREEEQLNTASPVVAALSSDNLSDFFSDLDTFSQINKQMQQSFQQISDTKTTTQAAEDELQAQKDQETQLLQVQQLQQNQVKAQQAKEQQILNNTNGTEASYQTLLAANQKSAAQIRAELFQLTGSAAIPFGTALEYAQEAQKATGIRPAFLLGIITEESNLGQNVGTGTWTVDMNPTRDAPVFKAITASLGLDPNSMAVSKRQSYGWGGAMGPAQFIPSTWALYAGYVAPSHAYNAAKDRVGALTGNHPPNPWNPEDAFMAAGLYLTDDGAAAQTPAAEFKAAMCYLTGCGNASDQSLWFYGNQVLCYELKYQQDIDTIEGTNEAPAMEANSLYYGQC